MYSFDFLDAYERGGGGLTVKATLFDSRIKSVTRHAIIVNFYKCVAPQMWPAP